MLINIHTHIRTDKENQLELVIDEDSIGIHPWEVDKPLNFTKARNSCLLIGETGLDRSDKYKANLKKQERIFRIHLAAAMKFKLPVVIHCVRAHSDILQILKEVKFSGKLLLHDFSGNREQIRAYLNFDTYFSFRRKFNLLESVPPNRVFLETDDQIHTSLEEIYILSGVSEEQCEKNLLDFFSDTQDVSSSDVIDYFRLAIGTN